MPNYSIDGASDGLRGWIREHGLPFTKAAYVLALWADYLVAGILDMVVMRGRRGW